MREELFNITLDNLSGQMMLTIEPKEEVVVNDFCCEMIKKTNIEGLLKLNVTMIDGSIKFNYDLSKKKSIAEYAKAGFNESYGKRILYNLCNAFLKLNEYYLKPSYCLLNPDFTYIGDGLNVYLPYIPIKDVKAENDELKFYFSDLLSRYFAVEGIAAYDEMFKYVYQCQTLDLNHFISKFLSSEVQNANNFAFDKQVKMEQKMPLPNVNNVPNNNQNIVNNSQKVVQNINIERNSPKPSVKLPNSAGFKMPGGQEIKLPGGGGFKMPGAPVDKIQNNVNQSNKVEKEKKGLFGFGKKKENASPKPVQNIPNNNQDVNIPNQNISNNNFQQFNNNQNNNFQNNIPPRFPNGFQGSMDKTIMIDGMNEQSGNQMMPGSSAYLQYRGQNIPINDNEFVIGKANDQYKVSFVINNNPHVSRKHATIIRQGNSYFIRDEGSTNGTYVNGRSLPKMVPQPLQNGDEISIYDEVFKFCM